MEIMKSWPDPTATPPCYPKKVDAATFALHASANTAAMPRMRVQLFKEGESFFARFDACERSLAGFMPLTTTLGELLRAVFRKHQRAPRLLILLHAHLCQSLGEDRRLLRATPRLLWRIQHPRYNPKIRTSVTHAAIMPVHYAMAPHPRGGTGS